MSTLDAAVRAIAEGEVVVYPTETVYGLGADASSASAIERVFQLKNRDRTDPLSVAVATVADVESVANPCPATRAFLDAFLPGPITVVCERRETLPAELTGGLDRVGVRVPDHDLAQALLARSPPLTATSANPSGAGGVTDLAGLAPGIREGVAVIVDGGATPGGVSTVVDVERGVIHRRGEKADAVERWLDRQSSP